MNGKRKLLAVAVIVVVALITTFLQLETEARAAASARLTSSEHFQQEYLQYLSGVGATIKDTTASPTR